MRVIDIREGIYNSSFYAANYGTSDERLRKPISIARIGEV